MARPSKASEFLKSVRGKIKTVQVNGADVHLRPLSAKELFEFRKWHGEHSNDEASGFAFMKKFVVASVVDTAGSPILTEDDVDEIDIPTIEAIAAAISKLNGLEGYSEGEPQPGTTD